MAILVGAALMTGCGEDPPPQAKDFERTPVKVTITNFNPLNAADPSTVGDVPQGGCKFEFALPAGKDQPAHNSSFSVIVTAAADPALVAARYLEDKKEEAGRDNGFKDLAVAWGTQGCYSYGSEPSGTADCFQGQYLFEVGGTSSAEGLAPIPGPSFLRSVVASGIGWCRGRHSRGPGR